MVAFGFLMFAALYLFLAVWLLAALTGIGTGLLKQPGYLVSSDFLTVLAHVFMLIITLIVLFAWLTWDTDNVPNVSESAATFTDYIIGYLVFAGIVLIIPFWFNEVLEAHKIPRRLLLVAIVYYASFSFIAPQLMSWLSQNHALVLSLRDILLESKDTDKLFFLPLTSPIRGSTFGRHIYAVFLTLSTSYIFNVVNAIIFIGAFAEGVHVVLKLLGKIRARFF